MSVFLSFSASAGLGRRLRAAVVVLAGLCGLAPALAGGWSTRPYGEVALHPEFRAPAAVHARDEARIAAEVAGRVIALPWGVGEQVAAGAELARIEDDAYRLEVARASAQVELFERRLQLAEAQLAQAEALAGRGFISADGLRVRRTELGVLQSEHAAARQALAQARLQQARTLIRAPFAGVVRERSASVGDLAVAGTPLLVLAAGEDAEVRAQVPAAQVADLQAAGAWRLRVAGVESALRLLRVSPLVSAAGQTREAVFAAPAGLAPGAAGELRWNSPVPHLPPEWVLSLAGRAGVWRVREGVPFFEPLPQAEAGRPVPWSQPADTLLVDEGRHALGLDAATRAGGAAR